MPATIRLWGAKATVSDRTWSCDASPLLQRMLNALVPPQSSGSDPDPDGNLAKAAVKHFRRHAKSARAELVNLNPPATTPGVVY